MAGFAWCPLPLPLNQLLNLSQNDFFCGVFGVAVCGRPPLLRREPPRARRERGPDDCDFIWMIDLLPIVLPVKRIDRCTVRGW
jgi:hypothetical protein